MTQRDAGDSIPPIPIPPVEAAATAPPATPQFYATDSETFADPYAPAGQLPPHPERSTPAPPAAYPAAPQAYAPAAPPAVGPAQGLSITSMILGIVGLLGSLVAAGFLPGLAAVITGHLARRRQPWAKSFWLTGIITGYISIAIGLVAGLFLGLAIFIGIVNS